MLILLVTGLVCLLLRSQLVMDAASAACRLFVTAVLPGLLPYMVLSLMLVSRVKQLSPALVMLLGWGGGSPTGARLAGMGDFSPRERVRLLVSCATMSPMFLLGTIGGWLGSPLAGAVCLGSAIISGWLTGWLAGSLTPRTHTGEHRAAPAAPLSFGMAVEQSARTMLLVCGTMVMLRVFAALAGELLPVWAILPITTLLEVTTGTQAIAELPLPLIWRNALIAGATGFGGFAILLQNRAVAGETLPLFGQVFWQSVHGAMAFLLALGMMHLLECVKFS